MRLKEHEQVERRLGNGKYVAITLFIDAVEEELRRYEFGARARVVAEVQYASPTIPEYPQVFVTLTWGAVVQGERELHSLYGAPVREVVAMVAKDIPSMNMALHDYVYRFAQKLLTTLVLIRRPRETTETGTGRTRTGPELQNIPAPRREPGW